MQYWSVRDPDSPGHLGLAASSHGCVRAQCTNGDLDKFDSLQRSLEHLHNHEGGASHGTVLRLHDDPCVVWLSAHHKWSHDHWRSTIRPIIDALLAHVSEMRARAVQIGRSCFRQSEDPYDPSVQHNLPRSLVEAFETVMILYQITATRLSDCNLRVADPYLPSGFQGNGVNSSGTKLAEEFDQYTAKLEGYLADAQKHAILWNSVDEQPEGFDWQSVGREFLLTVALGALQSRLLGDGGTNGDLTTVFKQRTSRLHFLTRTKPSKRLFTEINALETDLEALRHMTQCQADMLKKTKAVFDPNSFETARVDRLELFDMEVNVINELEDQLDARDFEISQLTQQAQHLKTQVMQALDVLEEGHVKAIRVFTVVTLFFLPM